MTFLLKRYAVNVKGFSEVSFDAASHGQARAAAYRSFASFCDATSFKDFLRMIVSVRRDKKTPTRYGEEISVLGEKAYYVSHDGNYVQFVHPNSTTILNSHPLDVKPNTPPQTPQRNGSFN